MSFKRVQFASFASLFFSAIAWATPLNLTPSHPDTFSDGITVTYDAGTHAFDAVGYAEELVDQSLTHHAITGAQGFDISASIDNSGNGVSGSLSITGAVTDLGAGTPLLTGSLTGFGYPLSGDHPLEFLFQVTGGSLATAGLYGTPGPTSVIGIVISQVGSNYVDWNHSFNNFNNIVGAVADSFSVPEPSTFFAAMIVGVSLLRRRR